MTNIIPGFTVVIENVGVDTYTSSLPFTLDAFLVFLVLLKRCVL